MGIRYYGWAISADEVIEAADDPWPVIRRADRRYHLPGWTNTDFDKAWPLMQGLLSPHWPETRPGYALLAGDVTYPHGALQGYEPHIGVLAPDRVPAVARDVGSVSPGDVRQYLAYLCYDDQERRRTDERYLTHYLAAARDFTADAAARGHGIIYQIG